MEKLTSFVVDVTNSDKTPKIEREMTSTEWGAYNEKMTALQETMRENAKFECSGIDISLKKDISLPLQDTEEFASMSYHKIGFNPQKSIATSGNFPLTVQAVLRYFGKEVKLEDLIQIAQYGDWISEGGGTYWHFIDAVCFAYDLCAVRISSFTQVEKAIENGGLTIALLKHDLFPQGLGNHLGVLTKVKYKSVFMKSTSSGECEENLSTSDFMGNCLALWAIVE